MGGLLYALTRWVPFVVDAASYLISSVAIARIRTPLPASGRGEPLMSLSHDIVEGLRFLMSRGFLRAIVAFARVANFAGNLLFLVLTLKLLKAGVHPAAIGLIDTIAAVAGIAGSVAAPAMIRRVPNGLLAIGLGLVLMVAVVPWRSRTTSYLVATTPTVCRVGSMRHSPSRRWR